MLENEELELVHIEQQPYPNYTEFGDGTLKSFDQLVPRSWCETDGKLDKWSKAHYYNWSYTH